MSVEYLDLADFVAISAAVTGLDEDTIAKVADLGLADSALHAPRPRSEIASSMKTSSTRQPFSSFDVRAITHSPTAISAPRGCRCEFIDINGWSWSRRPELEEGEETVPAIAAGKLDEERTAAWLRGYLIAPSDE